MRYEFTEEEQSIQHTAARFIEEATQKQSWDPAQPGAFDRSVYREMGDLGFFSLSVPEEFGGIGLGYPAQGLVLESAGYFLLQGPILDHCAALSILASYPKFGSLIPELGAGQRLATAAIGWRRDGTESLRVDDDGRTTGFEIAGYADAVTDLVVLAGEPDDGLRVIATETNSLQISHIEDQDFSWRGGGVSEIPQSPGAEWLSIQQEDGLRILSRASSLAAAYSLGCSQRLLDDTASYVKERQQFGRPIGSFQAIKHLVADLYIEIEHTRSLIYAALGSSPSNDVLLGLMAKKSAAATLDFASHVALQSHGGIGFTWESPIHRYVRAGLRLNRWPLTRAAIDDLIYDLAVDR